MIPRLFRQARRRLWRNRRRHVICGFLLFRAGAVGFADRTETLYLVPFWATAGMAFVVGILPFAVLLCLLIPS